ncbi:MAG: 23S rRNA (adenine(2503)-C(2))-methyltransferase RlmN [Lachnospiraceae bacterium]|nr:23S rRNA (adenine(2503)-C(2))-methyltransferase RlmN [Lachnospiraceae bacterium]
MEERHMDLRSMSYEELQEKLVREGEKPYRAGQLFSWLHKEHAASYEEMTNLSAALCERLAKNYPLCTLKTLAMQEAKDKTRKYLFRLPDGETVESVYMRYRFGVSVCVSSEVGCRMGCKFCASTIDGLTRKLSPAEMLEQVYAITRDTKEKVSHVVVMGMGEPLENLENVLRFIALLTDERGLNLSARNITVSTCGLVPEILALAEKKLQINLAISLHAPTQEQREQLMPVAKRYPLDMLMAACRDYYEATHRQLTFEYALVKGDNDSKEDALRLAALLGELNCMVNLIPVNPVKECGLSPTDKTDVLNFKKLLEKNRIHVTIRREMGREIDGACGQLRRRKA